MENKKTAVFGIYTTVAAADLATDSLVKSGFSAADVSALLPENLGSKPIATEKNSKAPEGAATGAGSGAVLGGALGLLTGIGALAIPGVGPLIAAGPIMAALAGVGVGGAVGGFTGALIGMGIGVTRMCLKPVGRWGLAANGRRASPNKNCAILNSFGILPQAILLYGLIVCSKCIR
jgi:hypothetical protein